jgi:hypothetical protein
LIDRDVEAEAHPVILASSIRTRSSCRRDTVRSVFLVHSKSLTIMAFLLRGNACGGRSGNRFLEDVEPAREQRLGRMVSGASTLTTSS